MKALVYLVSGLVFAWGLLMSGMTDAAKVRGFLAPLAESWSPALLFVLGPAALLYLTVFAFVGKRGRSLDGAAFSKPRQRALDARLLMGAAIFGVGWGLSGVCPGPALVRLAFADAGLVAFVAAMLAGFELERFVRRRRGA